MKNKKISITFLTIFASILYIIFCFRPLSTELLLTPEWTVQLSDEPTETSSTLGVLPFKLGQKAGYFTHDGKIAVQYNFPYKAAISKKYFASFSQNAENTTVYSKDGKEAFVISGAGFPFFTKDRQFLLTPGGAGVEFIDDSGNEDARFEYSSPITALSSSEKATVIGFANGTLCTFDRANDLQYTLNPRGSNLDVILGAGISQSGRYFACISGHSKQRFVLYENENSHAKIIFHKYLPEETINQSLIYFSDNESKVFYNDSTGLGIVDCKTFKEKHIPIPGRILDIQESPVANSLFVLSKESSLKKYTVTVIEYQVYKTSSFSFEADSAFILTDENSLFLGKDNSISKLTLSKE